jgi:hypothetical protein
MVRYAKLMGWLMLFLNLVLLLLVSTMHTMAAMWLMALIMTIDSICALVHSYSRHS